MKKTLSFLMIICCLPFLPETQGAPPTENRYYSIQIAALPLSQKNEGFSIYERLKAKGYLAYYYRIKIKNEWWMRLKVGVFASIPEAQAFGKKFKEQEGFDFFVSRAEVTVEAFETEFQIVTTPSAVWLKSDTLKRELFLFSPDRVQTIEVLASTRPVISPDGRKLRFNFGSSTHLLDIGSQKGIDNRGVQPEASAGDDTGRPNADRLERAISDLSKTINTDPNNARAYYNRGNLYQRKGDDDKAIADYTRAIEINPYLAEVFNNRGVAYRKKGLYDKAIEDYSRAIALKADDAEAYHNRGIAYCLGRAQYEKALADFSRAIEIDPAYAKAYYNRGFVYFLKKDYDHAWKDVRKAHALGFQLNPVFIKRLREASGQ